MERGLVQVYTGDGKGKTTAALGLALRACGHGLRVFLAQFAKGRPSGEIEALARYADLVTVRRYGQESFIVGEPSAEDRRLARAGWQEVREMAAAAEEAAAGKQGACGRWLSAAQAFSSLLRGHISKENHVLFVMAERMLSESEQSELAGAFERVEVEKMGAGTHERLHGVMDRLVAGILS